MNASHFVQGHALGRFVGLALATVLTSARPVFPLDDCPFLCSDLNGDGVVDLVDFAAFADCMGQPPGVSQECLCADMDGSGAIDLRDFALLAVLFGGVSDETPPNCTGAPGSTADLTAYRPLHGAGYAPFARTAVDEADEESETLGPGVRINLPGDQDPAGEDDLIEVGLHVDPPGALVALHRTDAALRVWTTREKLPGTEIVFTADRTDALPLDPAQADLTLWVEWASPVPGTAALDVEPLTAFVPKDTLVFHSFQSIVVALGGENQVPSDPADAEAGTFAVAIDLYRMGYDVHMYDEDDVAANGTGAVFNEVADAVQHRGVDAIAIFGYSHGGGSTYSLANLLNVSRPGLGVFEIEFTAYVDAVRNNSDIDVAQELRRPPSSLYHLNQYQRGVFFEDFALDGGPVPGSHPPPNGLDVETTPWGAGSTHFEVDDFVEVRDLIKASLEPRVIRELRTAPLEPSGGTGSGHLVGTAAAPAFPHATRPISSVVRSRDLANGPGDGPAVFSPDPAWQAAIESFVRARTPAQKGEALDQLRALDDTTHEQLVRQVVNYSSHAPDTPGAMAAGAILHALNIPDVAVIDALVPLLCTTDAELGKSVRSILGGFEG